VIAEETSGIDFYNILSKIPQPKKQSSLRKVDEKIAYDLMVLYKRSNLLQEEKEESEDEKLNKLMNGPVKRALNIPKQVVWGSQSNTVFKTLTVDFMKPAKLMVEKLLNETDVNVVVYTGTLDLICSTPATIRWINNLNWEGNKKYSKSKRSGFYVNKILEGYQKQYGRLSVYWILRAGHMAPLDNPAGMSYVLKRTTDL
jgi:serine carboxypeptidase 1